AIVIPVYPYTKKEDIDWKTIGRFKKLFYGHSYRPTSDRYEKIVKVFRIGQLLEERAAKEKIAYKSWLKVADGLSVSTITYIYDKAHELVYGHPSKKRRYKSGDATNNPETWEAILKDNGRGRTEPLVSQVKRPNRRQDHEQSDKNDTDEIDSFRKVFDELREDTA